MAMATLMPNNALNVIIPVHQWSELTQSQQTRIQSLINQIVEILDEDAYGNSDS